MLARVTLVGLTLMVSACAGPVGPPAIGDPGRLGDAGGAGDVGGAAATGLFVTMEDASGTEAIFRMGETVESCAGRLGALVEPGCPRLSMYFDVHGDDPTNWLELYAQGAYGFVTRSDGALHNRTVSDIAIDGIDEQHIATGHYRMVLDESPGPGTDIWGQFALCSEIGLTVEPCRNM